MIRALAILATLVALAISAQAASAGRSNTGTPVKANQAAFTIKFNMPITISPTVDVNV